jgi:DNA repair protein RadD
MIELRPYQSQLVSRIYDAFNKGHRRVLVPLPTGGGKTIVASRIIGDCVGKEQPVLFLAHRDELVTQPADKLHDFGIPSGYIKASLPSNADALVQIASVQTMNARCIKSSRLDLPSARLIVVDEAHHGVAETWRAILERYPDALILGLSATPCRPDGRGLGDDFDMMVAAPQVQELIDLGYLVGCNIFAPYNPDMTGARTAHGDYLPGDVDARMNTPKLVGDIGEHYFKHAHGRRTIVYASSVSHSVNIRNELNRLGANAAHIDGNTDIEERRRILADFKAGIIDVITNFGVLVEGFDCPEVSAIILARPTKSLGLYRQMVGRGLRSAPGKTDCLILDHSGAALGKHGRPEDDVEWFLEPDRQAINRTHASRGTYEKPDLVKCPECSALRLEGQKCTACGWQPRAKSEAVDVQDGDLVRVDRKGNRKPEEWSQGERDGFYGQLKWYAQERGYQQGWAKWKYHDRFKVWPSNCRAVPIMPPRPETLSWIKADRIRNAKRREKERQAQQPQESPRP